MANSLQQAKAWLCFLLEQDLPFVEALRSQVAVGKVGELCECGCHGFGFEIPTDTKALPLQEGAGLFYELAFASNFPDEIDMLVFTDERGYLSWVDVMYGACNVAAMPEGIVPGQRKGAWPNTRIDLPTIDVAKYPAKPWWQFWM